MNVQEFSALKEGDKVRNYANGDGGGTGEVVETTDSGVRVVWGNRHDRETRFFYSVAGTAWFQWTRIDVQDGAA